MSESMSESPHALDSVVERWLQPLGGDAGSCGVDVEYDNDFLALCRAAAGKPESQFAAAEPPDWRKAIDLCDTLFERSRDLRVAVLWLRSQLNLEGYAALAPGLLLVDGLLDQHWDDVHPLPDNDDDTPQYPRLNALAVLRENDGLLGDLRRACVVADRAVGELTLRNVEVAMGLSAARDDEVDMAKPVITQLLAAALARRPELRADVERVRSRLRALMNRFNDRFGVGNGPDLRPIHALVQGLHTLMPAEEAHTELEGQDADVETGAAAAGSTVSAAAAVAGRGLSGRVTSREEAIRAIDLVCEYLEAAEPTNPAPLFLRRARQLIGHNFLQLMKVLAPDALATVAGMVGVNPDTVVDPDEPAEEES
ncbi:MAG: type secretion system protein TssA [Pseudomonadota bacterium]|jgi:type VI secretion system protein ImpA